MYLSGGTVVRHGYHFRNPIRCLFYDDNEFVAVIRNHILSSVGHYVDQQEIRCGISLVDTNWSPSVLHGNALQVLVMVNIGQSGKLMGRHVRNNGSAAAERGHPPVPPKVTKRNSWTPESLRCSFPGTRFGNEYLNLRPWQACCTSICINFSHRVLLEEAR